MTKRAHSPNASAFQHHTKELRLSRTLTAQYYSQLESDAKKRAADAKLPKDRDGRIRSPGRKGMLPASYIAHLRWMLERQSIAEVRAVTGKGDQWLRATRDGLNRPECVAEFSPEWDAEFSKARNAGACADGKAVP